MKSLVQHDYYMLAVVGWKTHRSTSSITGMPHGSV